MPIDDDGMRESDELFPIYTYPKRMKEKNGTSFRNHW